MVIVGLLVLLAGSGPARATLVTWIDGNGNYSVQANWNPAILGGPCNGLFTYEVVIDNVVRGAKNVMMMTTM